MASVEHLSLPPRPGSLGAEVGLAVAVALARVVVTVVVGLSVAAMAPSVVAGWWSGVVVSGSMAPALRVGDVVVTRPSLGTPEPGRVVAVHDPRVPSRVLVHRVNGITSDGSLVTRGDANAGPDSTPVARDAVIGAAVVRVPFVGLPVVWARDGEYPRLAIGIGALALLALLGSRRTGPLPLLRPEGRHAHHPAPWARGVPAARHHSRAR